jgi:hypothetical protein
MSVGSPAQIDSPMAHVCVQFGLPVGSVSVGIVWKSSSSPSKVSGYLNFMGSLLPKMGFRAASHTSERCSVNLLPVHTGPESTSKLVIL